MPMILTGPVALRRSRVRTVLAPVVATLALMAAAPAVVLAQAPPSAAAFEDDEAGADVLGAVAASFRMLALQHGTRIALQEKTRSELGGSFWGDYRQSVRWPSRWGDTDGWITNYLGHPIQGAAAAYIWIDHDPRAPASFQSNRSYWVSRARSMAWSAVYSVQFEIGPFSEASIGNVGMRPQTAGWVDHVVTPTGGVGLVIVEDALDRFLIRKLESKTDNRFLRLLIRVALSPGRTMANTAAGRLPWHRQGRPLDW